MPDYTDDEDYQEFVNDLAEPFSDVHDDDVALEAILLKIAALYGPLDHLIFDDDEGEAESITVTFNYRTRVFSLAADRVTVAPDPETRDFVSRRITNGEELRSEIAEVIFTHSAEARGSAVTFQSASDRMKRTAYEYADAVIASGVLGVPADSLAAAWDEGFTEGDRHPFTGAGNPYRKAAGA